MSKSTAFLAAFFVAAGPACVSLALADEKPVASDAAATFAQLDSNKDGQLSADEIPGENKRLFERLLRTADKNSDGKLSVAEFSAGLAPEEQTKADQPRGEKDESRAKGRPAPEKMFRRLDANRDGKVTLDEVPEPRREGFKRLIARGDKDGDSALSASEFPTAFGEKKPSADQPPTPNDDAAAQFARLDKNSDGKLTVDETPEGRRKQIARMLRRSGKDRDQGLTLAEFVAGRERPDQAAPRAAPGEPARDDKKGRPGGLFGLLDTDHDGKLVASELSAAGEILRKFDKNHDATITPDEIFGSPGDK